MARRMHRNREGKRNKTAKVKKQKKKKTCSLPILIFSRGQLPPFSRTVCVQESPVLTHSYNGKIQEEGGP